jgi:hypothetical protein
MNMLKEEMRAKRVERMEVRRKG